MYRNNHDKMEQLAELNNEKGTKRANIKGIILKKCMGVVVSAALFGGDASGVWYGVGNSL